MDGVMDATDEMFPSRRSDLAAVTIAVGSPIYRFRRVSDDAGRANELTLSIAISYKDERRLATFVDRHIRMVRISHFRSSETKVIITSVFCSYGFVEDVVLSTRPGRVPNTFSLE